VPSLEVVVGVVLPEAMVEMAWMLESEKKRRRRLGFGMVPEKRVWAMMGCDDGRLEMEEITGANLNSCMLLNEKNPLFENSRMEKLLFVNEMP
jgi:hypothetical protein